jgi:hypothetical protein
LGREVVVQCEQLGVATVARDQAVHAIRPGAATLARSREAFARDRRQLFAEALREFRGSWWPGRDFEREFARPQEEARYEADAWEENRGVPGHEAAGLGARAAERPHRLQALVDCQKRVHR